MKNLNQFVKFDWNAFAKDKVFLVTNVVDFVDYDTKAILGKKVETVIITDNTLYASKDGEVVTNRFEKVAFKVSKSVDIPIDSRVVPVNPVATVYGDYRNQLSVKCDDVQIVTPKEK